MELTVAKENSVCVYLCFSSGITWDVPTRSTFHVIVACQNAFPKGLDIVCCSLIL